MARCLSAEAHQTSAWLGTELTPLVQVLDHLAPMMFDEEQLAYACPCLNTREQAALSAEDVAEPERREAQFRAQLAWRFPQQNFTRLADQSRQTLQAPSLSSALMQNVGQPGVVLPPDRPRRSV